jgi:hypothetical protein
MAHIHIHTLTQNTIDVNTGVHGRQKHLRTGFHTNNGDNKYSTNQLEIIEPHTEYTIINLCKN